MVNDKLVDLRNYIKSLESVAVAFSSHIRYEILAGIEFLVVIVSIVAYTVFACDMRNCFVCVHIVVAAGIIACIASFIQEKMMPGLEVFLG